MKYKRRIVYLTDEQWAALQAQARGEETTISNLIRHGIALIPPTRKAEESAVEFHAPKGAAPLRTPDAKSAQAKRDAILRGVNRK